MIEARDLARLHFCLPNTEKLIIYCWIPASDPWDAGMLPAPPVFFKGYPAMTTKAFPKETIKTEGWRAEPAADGGFNIHSPGSYDTYRGWAKDKTVAIKWIEDASGLTYRRLPAIKMQELTVQTGARLPLAQFPFRPKDYYQHVFYHQGDKLLGSVQIKSCRGRVTTLTSAVGHGAVIGRDLRWMCEQHGLRLEDE